MILFKTKIPRLGFLRMKKKKKLRKNYPYPIINAVFIYLFVFMRLSHAVKRISSYPLLFFTYLSKIIKILNFRLLVKSLICISLSHLLFFLINFTFNSIKNKPKLILK